MMLSLGRLEGVSPPTPPFFLNSRLAVEEAMKFVKRQKLKAKQCEEDEKKLFGDADTIDEKQLTTEKEANKESTETATTTTTAEWTKEKLPMVQEEIIEDNFWDWKDHNQVGTFYIKFFISNYSMYEYCPTFCMYRRCSVPTRTKNQYPRCRCIIACQRGEDQRDSCCSCWSYWMGAICQKVDIQQGGC
jgi:hypothetical protein